jgi:K+-transporting ATPase ATPase C chain
MRILWTSTKALLVFTVLTGLLYPLLITGVGFLAFRDKATGSLLRRGGVVVGSKLLAQKVEDPAYFWFRPSAGDYATVASGASNLSPASAKFVEAVEARRKAIGNSAPPELLMASGSGLDPEISPEGALYQVERIAQQRKLRGEEKARLRELIETNVENRTFGVLGQRRVNVMILNAALDEVFAKR